MVLTHASYYIGSSHLQTGTPVQDRAAVREITYSGGHKATALLLSDGHGSRDHYRSDIGAAMAIDAAAEALPYILEVLPTRMDGSTVRRGVADNVCLTDSDRTPADPRCEAAMRMFFTRVNALWAKKVLEHWNTTPRPGGESSLTGAARAYGCTLLGAVRAEGFWLAFQLGDGACVAISDDGVPSDPIPHDSRCHLSRTTSMCIHGARDFRYAYGSGIPPAMMLCSDGLADCFENNLDLATQFLAQIVIDNDSDGFDSVVADIQQTLPELSRQYTRDDMSIALWIDSDAATRLIPQILNSRDSRSRHELSAAYDTLQSYNESIVDIETHLSAMSPDQSGERERKLSALSTLKRMQRELLDQIDSLKLNLNNRP